MRRILFFFLIGLMSCSKDDGPKKSLNCDFETSISSQKYTSASSKDLIINNVVLTGDCLNITFSSAGCSGASWVVELIDSGEILESAPPQRKLKLSFENDESCEAYITKELAFDLSNLRVEGNELVLKLDNYPQDILYQY